MNFHVNWYFGGPIIEDRAAAISRGIPTLHGRRGEGITHNQTHSSSFPDMWRNPDNNRESNTNRNKDSYQGEQQIDHWTRFINVIEHAQKSAPSLEPRYNTQPVQEKSTSSPRRLPREKLPSPDHTCLGVGEHYRLPSPGWNRNEPVEREPSSDRHLREMRGRSYPRHPEEKRRDRIDYGYPNECGNRFHERGSISERSSKSDYKDHHPSKGLNDVSLQDEFARHRRTSPFGTPVIVEHDHGITKHGSRDRDRQDMGGYSRNRDQRNRDPERNRRDQGHHSHPSQDYRQGARFYGNPREETRKNYSSYRRESQGRERSRHIDQFKMDSHSRDSEGRKRMHFRESSEANLWTKKRNPVNEWEEERMQRNQERMMDEEEAHHRAQRNRNLESNVGSPPKMEFCKQETLKIKVDMSRPIMQAR
ncbi:hypothetical protein DNTS_015366 [Danionella cerebrum]|uniref:Uncharacterized protein n=1 Tax=Danionella cerebrum TaxID=2873325 RepID=A0A553NWV5_9TELE|nr:hypothetical protein DNTS_015366 [Danionella translucida]